MPFVLTGNTEIFVDLRELISQGNDEPFSNTFIGVQIGHRRRRERNEQPRVSVCPAWSCEGQPQHLTYQGHSLACHSELPFDITRNSNDQKVLG